MYHALPTEGTPNHVNDLVGFLIVLQDFLAKSLDTITAVLKSIIPIWGS